MTFTSAERGTHAALPARSPRRRARRVAARFLHRQDGATAIEFGIVGLLFFTLIFGIIELAMIFFTSSVLAHSVSDAGRAIRVGQFQECGTQDEFRDLVCSRMTNLINCQNNLRIDVISADTFREINLPTPDNSDLEDDEAVPNGDFDETVAGDPVAVRASFYYPLLLPPAMTRLESRDPTTGAVQVKGRRVIVATTAFRNEPFPAATSCDADIAAEIESMARDDDDAPNQTAPG